MTEAAPTLRIETTSVDGSGGQLFMWLDTDGESIAALQNDLAFPEGVRVRARANRRPDCRANSEIHKDGTSFVFGPRECDPSTDCKWMRAIVIAVGNVEPIPDSSLLYTCMLEADDSALRSPILECQNFLGSDPVGVPIALECDSTELELCGSGTLGQLTVGLPVVQPERPVVGDTVRLTFSVAPDRINCYPDMGCRAELLGAEPLFTMGMPPAPRGGSHYTVDLLAADAGVAQMSLSITASVTTTCLSNGRDCFCEAHYSTAYSGSFAVEVFPQPTPTRTPRTDCQNSTDCSVGSVCSFCCGSIGHCSSVAFATPTQCPCAPPVTPTRAIPTSTPPSTIPLTPPVATSTSTPEQSHGDHNGGCSVARTEDAADSVAKLFGLAVTLAAVARIRSGRPRRRH